MVQRFYHKEKSQFYFFGKFTYKYFTLSELSVEASRNGYIITSSSSTFWGGAIGIGHQANGEIQFETLRATSVSSNFKTYIPMVMECLAGRKAMTRDFKLMVKVN